MKQTALLAATLAAIPVTAALAQSAPAAGPTPQQIIETRKAVMFLSGSQLATMRLAAQAEIDIRQLYTPALGLRAWARTLPNMFPAGSGVEPSRARPEIWSDRAGFEAAATAYADAVDRLAAAAGAGNREGFLERLTEVRTACGACHEAYKTD